MLSHHCRFVCRAHQKLGGMLALPVVGHPNKSHLKWTMNPEFRVKQTRQLVALVVYVICLYTDAIAFMYMYVYVSPCVTA